MQIDRPIAIALTLFIILLLVFFLVVPEYNTFQALQTSLGEKSAQYRAQFDYYAAIEKTYDDLQEHQEDIKKIDDALPAPPQDPTLSNVIYFLQETAKENGLIVKNLFLSQSSSSNAGAATTNSIKDMAFSMDTMGDYPSLQNFIISLENSSRIFEVTSISFGSASGPPYSFSLQIKTHSY
jgi:Tfp pilus assembly protein PilO